MNSYRRGQKYANKLDTKVGTDYFYTPEVTVLQRAVMKREFIASASHAGNIETKMRATLNGLGLPTIQYPSYLCYGRNLDKLVRSGISGESLAIDAQVLLDLWVARGLVQSALEKVRKNVFNVNAPVAP